MELTEPGKREIKLVEFVAANEVYIYIKLYSDLL